MGRITNRIKDLLFYSAAQVLVIFLFVSSIKHLVSIFVKGNSANIILGSVMFSGILFCLYKAEDLIVKWYFYYKLEK